MHRPTRQHRHLTEKLAKKASRRPDKKKRGAKERRWKKRAEQYSPLVVAA